MKQKFGLKSLLNCLVIWLIIILWGSFILFTVIHFYMLSCAIKQGPMRAQISHPHHSLIQFIMQYFAIHTYKTKCQYICSNSCLYFTTILVWAEMRLCGGWVFLFIILWVCTLNCGIFWDLKIYRSCVIICNYTCFWLILPLAMDCIPIIDGL